MRERDRRSLRFQAIAPAHVLMVGNDLLAPGGRQTFEICLGMHPRIRD
jgi:hypothetical protein